MDLCAHSSHPSLSLGGMGTPRTRCRRSRCCSRTRRPSRLNLRCRSTGAPPGKITCRPGRPLVTASVTSIGWFDDPPRLVTVCRWVELAVTQETNAIMIALTLFYPTPSAPPPLNPHAHFRPSSGGDVGLLWSTKPAGPVGVKFVQAVMMQSTARIDSTLALTLKWKSIPTCAGYSVGWSEGWVDGLMCIRI